MCGQIKEATRETLTSFDLFVWELNKLVILSRIGQIFNVIKWLIILDILDILKLKLMIMHVEISSINENKDLINNIHHVVFSKHCVFISELLGVKFYPKLL